MIIGAALDVFLARDYPASNYTNLVNNFQYDSPVGNYYFIYDGQAVTIGFNTELQWLIKYHFGLLINNMPVFYLNGIAYF